MKKFGIAGLIVLLLAIILVTSVKVTALDRSPLCDHYRISSHELYIHESCLKEGK